MLLWNVRLRNRYNAEEVINYYYENPDTVRVVSEYWENDPQAEVSVTAISAN
jgi:hypothetical protein